VTSSERWYGYADRASGTHWLHRRSALKRLRRSSQPCPRSGCIPMLASCCTPISELVLNIRNGLLYRERKSSLVYRASTDRIITCGSARKSSGRSAIPVPVNG
jgi:hypothetical protein